MTLYKSPLGVLLKRATLAESILLLLVLLTATIELAVWQSDPCHLASHVECGRSGWPLVVATLVLILALTHLSITAVCIRSMRLERSAQDPSGQWKDFLKFSLGLPILSVGIGFIWSTRLMPLIADMLVGLIRRIEHISY